MVTFEFCRLKLMAARSVFELLGYIVKIRNLLRIKDHQKLVTATLRRCKCRLAFSVSALYMYHVVFFFYFDIE